jgi:hypothetical protein
MAQLKISSRLVFCLSIALAGCATPYPGPRTGANSQVSVRATGLQRHGAFQDDKLLVRIFIGKYVQGGEVGIISLTPDLPTTDFKLDQGTDYTLWVSSIEPHFGGFTSCGFLFPFTPTKDEAYRIEYATALKATCEMTMSRIDPQGTISKILHSSNVAGGNQFTARIVRY